MRSWRISAGQIMSPGVEWIDVLARAWSLAASPERVWHMRCLVFIVLACLLSLPARAADKAIASLDGLTGEFALYVCVPAVTPELAGALLRAHGRGVHMDVMIPEEAAGSPEVYRLRDAGVRVVIFERVTEAVILYDDARIAVAARNNEGPDAQ